MIKVDQQASCWHTHVNVFFGFVLFFLNDVRVLALRSMSSYFHICICSGLKSTDSWSNTIKANVTPTITSVNALRCAYRSTDNNSSNVLWSLMLLKVPLCCGWVCMRQRNVPQHVLLTISKWNICFAASCLLNQNRAYIYTSLICIYIHGRCRYCLLL